ncbi:hypothetical protein KL86SPO_31516 [uncultured Sporomusa sp.]|uniref:Uncharacterized protein n=1 Tax=uncultured Sporomusa sp. TaxID=307249 RepID=A0A212LV48_9FIRM|nr:hypothetical protein KL86SPO_31516 [uncultured Sporomusa sp.]
MKQSKQQDIETVIQTADREGSKPRLGYSNIAGGLAISCEALAKRGVNNEKSTYFMFNGSYLCLPASGRLRSVGQHDQSSADN